MAVTSGVKAVITADAKKLMSELGRAQKQISSLREQNKKLRGSFGSLVKSISPVSLGVTGVALGMGKLVSSMRTGYDEIGKFSKSLGISVDTLQRWQHTAKLSGTSLDAFTKGARTLAGAIFDANSGLKTYQRAFESLGISYEELQGLSPEEQMNRVADALSLIHI